MSRPSNRRLLPYETNPAPPPLPAAAGDAAVPPGPQLYSSSKSMAVTALIVLLALFFFGFFSVYAHRLVSGLRGNHARRLRAARRQRGSLFAPACGLDPSVVLALPVLRYVGRGEGGGKEGCIVCLSDFEEKERVKVIPRCGHVFHPGCIDVWLVSRGSCPICRCSDMFGSCSSSGFLGLEVVGGAEEEERRSRGEEEATEEEGVGLGSSGSCCSWRGQQGVEEDKVAEV